MVATSRGEHVIGSPVRHRPSANPPASLCRSGGARALCRWAGRPRTVACEAVLLERFEEGFADTGALLNPKDYVALVTDIETKLQRLGVLKALPRHTPHVSEHTQHDGAHQAAYNAGHEDDADTSR